eukprot:CAMPEP_0182513336 /NCGR_PEP_ID=MMETSP1321-20130603/33861_1 /TAXON_ID=91990 /ORGANISM="Bolidomonas sp., Strain RCC1657" /LENGTH=88 /DNA_ID=CAMNT_0024720335 /DNA_START=134 /DNA_END=402 /DNA_ORIENTATION=+
MGIEAMTFAFMGTPLGPMNIAAAGGRRPLREVERNPGEAAAAADCSLEEAAGHTPEGWRGAGHILEEAAPAGEERSPSGEHLYATLVI